MAYDIPTMVSEATGVLKSLIAIPSLSRDEEKAADYLQSCKAWQPDEKAITYGVLVRCST